METVSNLIEKIESSKHDPIEIYNSIDIEDLHNMFLENTELPDAIGKLASNIWRTTHRDKSFILEGKLLEYWKSIKNFDKIVISKNRISALKINTGKHKEALEDLKNQRTYIIDKEGEESKHLINVYINIGLCNVYLNNLEESYKNYLLAEELAINLNKTHILPEIYINMQSYFYAIQDNDSFEKVGLKGLKISSEHGNKRLESAFLANLGTHYFSNHKYDKAIDFFQQARSYLIEQNINHEWIAMSTMNIGAAYRELQEYNKAHAEFEKSRKLCEDFNMQNILAKLKLNIAMTYFRQNELNLAFEEILVSEKRVRELGVLTDLRLVLRNKVEILHAKKNYDEEVMCYQELLDLQERIFNEHLSEKSAELRTKFETEQKERERQILQQKNAELEKRNEELEKAQEEIRILARKNTVYAMAVTANHELNQPLTVIKGNMEMIELQIGNLNSSNKKHFDRISTSLDRIDDILQKYRENRNVKLTEYADDTVMVSFDE